MNGDPISVATSADQEQAAQIISRYDLHTLPVVDSEKRLVGIITFDDVLDVVEEEATEDIERMAGIEPVGAKYKVRHRADFGISVLKDYWGLGLGRALAKACIRCAKDAGYVQLELNAVAENERALALYRDLGFVEYGRNPRGFNSRLSGYQELVYMLLEL